MVTGSPTLRPRTPGADLDDLASDLVADDAGELHLPPPGLGVLDGRPAPQVMTRATASPGPAAGSERCSNWNGRFGPVNTIAFMGFPHRLAALSDV